jgi:hypothetical protein
MVQYCSTLVRWGREELDHGEVEQRRVVAGKVLLLEPTTSFRSCQHRRRVDFWLSLSIRWTGRRPRELGAGPMHACRSRNETARDVGAKLPALRLCSSIRWAGRWPRGTESRSRSLCLLARAGAGLMYWSSNSSVARGAEHRRNGGACWGWGGWIAWGKTNSSLCWGKFRRALLCCA